MTEPMLVTAVDPIDLRPFMAHFPSGVAVLTTVHDGVPYGMTCSSLCSVSLDPPMVLVCVRAQSPTLAAITASGVFTVNLIHGDARPTAALFASGAADRFERVGWHRPHEVCGPHLTTDAVAIADCRVAEHKVVGDHVVVFGEVHRVTALGELAPLLYGRRRYAVWPELEA